MSILLFLVVVSAAALVGHTVLSWIGMDDAEAWAGGRTLGLVLVAFSSWWLGVLGVGAWRSVGVAALAITGVLSMWRWRVRRPRFKEILTAEAIFWGAALLVFVMRLDHPEILATEKPMDLGILATLLRADSFPPPDMWLAGEALPYYYWGALIWTVPLTASALVLDVGYNLIVALVGGLVAVLAWAIARKLAGGSSAAGLCATFFVCFAGTPDGLRQILSGVAPGAVSLWSSSRQVPNTITEFPLFTLWLGDLHPHLLSIPLACAAILVALHMGRQGVSWPSAAVVSVLFGVTWAANPWAMPPTLVAVALCMVCGDGQWRWPTGEGVRRWAAALGVAVCGWLVTAPFQLAFRPPLQGISLVSAWTRPELLLLYGGCLLAPVFALALLNVARCSKDDPLRRWALVLGWSAVTVVLAMATGRITMVFLLSALVAVVMGLVRGDRDPDRPAVALAALGLFLFLVPEILYVVDSYGEAMHRMNTVFKAYIQAWVMLALALPVLLRRCFEDPLSRRVVAGLLVAMAAPHLVAAMLGGVAADTPGLHGLRWMDEGDQTMIAFLRDQPPGTHLVEAEGTAYSTYGRLSSASGVPALLGWANHELVWRGSDIVKETGRRADVVRRIYTCANPEMVRELMAENGAQLVAIGALEREDYPVEGLAAVQASGEVVLEAGESVIVRVAEQPPSAGGER